MVVAVLAVQNPQPFRPLVRRAWKRYTMRKRRRRPLSEFKFYNTEDQDRHRILASLVRAAPDIVVLVVERGSQRVADTPGNYGLVICEAVETASRYFADMPVRVVRDRHFSQQSKQIALDGMIAATLHLPAEPADSKNHPLVQLADFVAGAFHRKYSRGDDRFANVVADLVLEERIVTWKGLKRKWVGHLTKKKTARTQGGYFGAIAPMNDSRPSSRSLALLLPFSATV